MQTSLIIGRKKCRQKFGTRVAGKQAIWRFFNAILTFAEFFDEPTSFFCGKSALRYMHICIYIHFEGGGKILLKKVVFSVEKVVQDGKFLLPLQ